MKNWPHNDITAARIQAMTDRFKAGIPKPSDKPTLEKKSETWDEFIARINAPVFISAELSEFLGLEKRD